MIRIISVAMTVVLYLIFPVSALTILRLRVKRDLVGVQEKSLSKTQGAFRSILKLAGVTHEVQGLENISLGRAVLYVGNHRSYFGILIGYVTVPGPTGFVAKKEVLKVPLLRTWMQRVNCLSLDRVDMKEELKTILEGIKKVKSDVSVWIFPEGTCNKNQELTGPLPSHEGGLRIVQKNGCPAISVAITDTAEIFEQHLPFVKPSRVCIRYGAPIYIKELPAEERKFPGAYTRDVIADMPKDMKEGQEQDK